MADIEVIYDPEKELAAIVNATDRCGWGPAMIGPNAGALLQAWIDGTPFDVSQLDAYTARMAFTSFLDTVGVPDAVAPDAASERPLGPGDDQSLVEARTAEREAHDAAGEPPGPAPADTDETASPPTQTVNVRCWNCNGEGIIRFGDGSEDQPCNMCHGTGKVEQEVVT